MPCWYDLENKLSPPDIDINHEKYGNFGLVFRVVKLTDLFPNNRTPRSNWLNEKDVISKIESEGYKIYADKPIYTIKLTPGLMSEIRQYNDKYQYSDWHGFNFNTGTSKFLENLLFGFVKI